MGNENDDTPPRKARPMKTRNWTPRIETLEDRNMLSASPLGEIAAPMPEPTHRVNLRWEKLTVPMTDGTAGMLLPAVQKVREAAARAGTHALYQDITIPGAQDDGSAAAGSGMSAGKVSYSDLSITSRAGSGVLKALDEEAAQTREHILLARQVGVPAAADAVFIAMGRSTEAPVKAGYDLKMAKKV
jgi:hypothetical protein